MTPERIADLQELCRPELIEALNSQRQLDFDGCEVGVSRQACDEAATILTALPELLAEVARLTRERDEAYNAGIEAAANVSIGSVARLPRITNTHKIAEICQFDPLQGWITKEDVIRYGSEITDGIRELKKPATGQATGEK